MVARHHFSLRTPLYFAGLFFHCHEFAARFVALRGSLGQRVLELRTLLDSTLSGIVAGRFVYSHDFLHFHGKTRISRLVPTTTVAELANWNAELIGTAIAPPKTLNDRWPPLFPADPVADIQTLVAMMKHSVGPKRMDQFRVEASHAGKSLRLPVK